MRIGFHGKLEDKKEIRVGFIGCGSHSYRNIYPTFQFAPVHLAAVCDFDEAKAKAFAEKLGAGSFYTDYHEMLAKEQLDAVFVVTNYDEKGRPRYPDITVDCLNAGCHVWIEKPPAAKTADIERMQASAAGANKQVMVGLKKMFFPANEKAIALAQDQEFGDISMVLIQYPQQIPKKAEFDSYFDQGIAHFSVVSFLDHLCHPAALMVGMLGLPKTLYYERNQWGGGNAMFHYQSGTIVSMAFTFGASSNGGFERTTIISNKGKHIVVDNNIRVSYHVTPPCLGYGDTPNYYTGKPGEATTTWEPEFSLGQLYNKGLFLLGYYAEVNEFATAILEGRPIKKGTLQNAHDITHIFECFREGAGKVITIS